MEHPSEGQRIRLVHTNDPHTNLRPGAKGTIAFVDDMGTPFVDWDNGSKLGLIPREDQWQVLPSEETGETAKEILRDTSHTIQ